MSCTIIESQILRTRLANIRSLYLIQFVAFLLNSIDSTLNPWVTSFFEKHGLLNVGSVMATALAGCIPLVTAKFIDVVGRVEGFFLMLLLALVGMAIKAACKNMETYIAGHVLYWAGHIGVLFVTDIMAADITSLKNRMIIFTLNSTPRIAATFAGPAIGEIFINNNNWRWAYGAFVFVFITCSLPATGIMMYMFRQAKRAGMIEERKSGRNVIQAIGYHFIQFDSKSTIFTKPIHHAYTHKSSA